ncbi:MAG TPA: M36 family metallopeptidase [Pyrinomonadaceae bacterium]|nr:M36 family metallopeptidase [Pyrinomonadaceae bacterium]
MRTAEGCAGRFGVAVWLHLVALALTVTITLSPQGVYGQALLFDSQAGLPDFDSRTSGVAPTAAQVATVSSLGATARWNRFGTPHSMVKYNGYLATGLDGDAITVARTFISLQRALFRLSEQGLSSLELLNDQKMAGYEGHSVLFRQKFGDLQAAQDGLIAVGVVGDKVVYVSSSCAGDRSVPGAASLTPLQAWLKAAANIGRVVDLASVTDAREQGDWTLFTVAGFSHPQRARLRAFPTPTGVRPVYETLLLNARGGELTGYTHLVDAQTGAILFRQNRVQQLAQDDGGASPSASSPFQGEYSVNPNACGSSEFEVTPGRTQLIITASAANPANDIVMHLDYNGVEVAKSADLSTSPETITYNPADGVAPGKYTVRVCPFIDSLTPHTAPLLYAGTFTQNTTSVTLPYPPKWRAFRSAPAFDLSSTDKRSWLCWVASINGSTVPGCEYEVANMASRGPWDFDFRTNQPTLTTKGNNAMSGQGWAFPLFGSEQYRPVSPTREYNFPWTNQWQVEKGATTVFASPQRNDIDAATVNLFAMHNRMHDFSYLLGFTEENYNLQDNNFGNRSSGGTVNTFTGDGDPELGNAQAGGVDGGQPDYLGRNNANQFTAHDGISPITNMYLWQAIANANYPNIVDGDYDMSVIGHEYTHAISNRMVGGPDASIGGHQGGAMGESWSDLVAMEYLNAYGLVPVADENPYAVGAYVTGNKKTGIRNFAMNDSPLNYGNVGYDTTGPQVHSDGEIWSATNFDIRQALIKKYNAQFSATDKSLQKDCADGKRAVAQCPGNRRWIQILFDAWLLMPSSPSMLDARDAYLAADMMRFGGANQKELWASFARRGMGSWAYSQDGEDTDPVPSFESPKEPNGVVTFKTVALEENGVPVKARIFVGQFEARSTQIADTDPSTVVSASNPRTRVFSDTTRLVPGLYDFIAQADGYGLMRFRRTIAAGTQTLIIAMPTNWASKAKGALVSGDGLSAINRLNLIDDTEATNWASLGNMNSANTVEGKLVVVKLGGAGPQLVNRVQVSALNHPYVADDAGGDRNRQLRLAALRQFKVLVCTASASNNCSDPNVGYSEIFTSPEDAFPGGQFRPTTSQLIIRSFNVPPTRATHVQLRVVTNQCTGQPLYQGDHDNDPLNNGDCVSQGVPPAVLATGPVLSPPAPTVPTETELIPQSRNVRAAEFQVFTTGGRLMTPGDRLADFTLDSDSVSGCQVTRTAKVTLEGPAPSAGTVVTINESHSGATFPVTVTVPAGQTSKTFTYTVKAANVPVTNSITASAGGVSVKRDLTVNPPRAASLTLAPNPVKGGQSVTGTVTLECLAPAGGITVSLASGAPAIASPTTAKIVVPAGSQKGTFTITTRAVTTSQRVVIRATAGGGTASATLVVDR